MGYRYNPTRKALITPARDAHFFAAGRPASEPVLCAEMARLAYAPFERDPAARALVEMTLQRIGFGTCCFFSAASTQGFLAQDSNTSLAVLAFRGTELDPRDWETDIKALLVPWSLGGQVHQGFAEALASIWEPVLAAITGLSGRRLYAGHSLGAALATLAASRRAPDALFTYGSPRVGDAAFAQATRTLTHHRYANCCDVVTRLPPEAIGYRHTGAAAYLNRAGNLCLDPAEELVGEDQRRARRGYFLRWSWRPGMMWTRDTADHAPVNYVSALAKAAVAAGQPPLEAVRQ